MAIFDQLSVVRIAGEHHLVESYRLKVFIEAGFSRADTAFLRLLGLPQSFACDPRHDHDDGNGGGQTNVFQHLPVEIGRRIRLPGNGVARRRADVHKEKCRRQHAQQIGQNVGAGANGGQAEKIVQQNKWENRAQTREQHHFETLAADCVVERAKLRIRCGPGGHFFPQESARQ